MMAHGGEESSYALLSENDVCCAANFGSKLYSMVTSSDQSIIGFRADGISFEVKDPTRLEREVLPKYFRHRRFQSLVRQLNFYSFKKATNARSSFVYLHEAFQLNRPELLSHLQRKKTSASTYGSSYNNIRSDCDGFSPSHSPKPIVRREGAIRQQHHPVPVPRQLAKTFRPNFSPSVYEHFTDEYDETEFDSEEVEVDTDSASYLQQPMNPLLHLMRQHQDQSFFVNPSPSEHFHSTRTRFDDSHQSFDLHAETETARRSHDEGMLLEEGHRWDMALRYFGVNGDTSNAVGENARKFVIPPHHDVRRSHTSQDFKILDSSSSSTSDASNLISPATESLVEFCLARNPWQDPEDLYVDVSKLLERHPVVAQELKVYIAAMFPDETSTTTTSAAAAATAATTLESKKFSYSKSSADSDEGSFSPSEDYESNSDAGGAKSSSNSNNTGNTNSNTNSNNNNNSNSEKRKRDCDDNESDSSLSMSSETRSPRKTRHVVGGNKRRSGSDLAAYTEFFLMRAFMSFAVASIQSLAGLVGERSVALTCSAQGRAQSLHQELTQCCTSWMESAQCYS